MSRHLAACVLIVVLLLASTYTTGEDGDRHVEQEVIDGQKWTKDLRITYNSAEDTMPQIVVDSQENAHIIWKRSGLWTKTLDSRGYALTKEIFITPHVVTGYGNPALYPLGPQIAIDQDANIHVVWDDGYHDCYYQKLDKYASPLIQPIQLGNDDAEASHVPSIAIDPVYGNIHIVHEDYEYQCEDIVYDKLDKNGKVLVNEVAISSDVSSHCEHSTLAPDLYGFIHVAFGTPTGCHWRKVDKNGVAQANSVKLPQMSSYQIADMAVTPNGDVHLVWTNDGAVRYTRMDNNGTMLDVNVTVSKGGVDPTAPRIAASHDDNSVHIVWDDRRDGNYEIYYAVMEEGAYNVTPKNVRLTDDPASSVLPRVAVSPDDSVHVVWDDYRDGNAEIYYKFMSNHKMEMAPVDVSELANMYFIHPGETKEMDVFIQNMGALPDDYNVTVTVDGWAAARGWSFVLNETHFPDVPGDGIVIFNITMTAPAMANPGDYVNVTLKGTAASGSWDDLAWRAFIIVEKGVQMVCDDPTKVTSAGSEVRFDLWVANIGDVYDTYMVQYTLIPDDTGWEVTVDAETIMLGVDESTALTVLLRVPGEAKANANASVFIRVQSMTDASVWDGKKLLAIVDPLVHLEMEAPAPTIYVDPAARTAIPIVVRNVGNMEGKLVITLSSTQPIAGWSAYLSHETLYLAGGEEASITLNVIPPSDAPAGTRQLIDVSCVSKDLAASSRLMLVAVVKQVHGINAFISPVNDTVHPGEVARFLMSVSNGGNGDEDVALGSALVPWGWDVGFEVDAVTAKGLTLAPGTSETVLVTVATPWDARAATGVVLHVVLTDSLGTSLVLPFHVNILGWHGVDLSSPAPNAEGAPGDTVVYHLVIHNTGNSVDTFFLDHDPLPVGWTTNFLTAEGDPLASVPLQGGGRREVLLQVRVPGDASAGSLDILVRATSSGAITDEVKLSLEVLLADLRITSVAYDPPSGRRVTQVTVEVANRGTSDALNATVVMMDGEKEVDRRVVGTLAPGGAANVTFRWDPSPGRHKLTYQVTADGMDADGDDNTLVHERTVGGDERSQPGFGPVMLLVALACVAVAMGWRWRQSS